MCANGYNKAIRERKNYIGFLMILFQRLVSTSTEAIIDAMAKRLNALEMQSEQLHSGNFSDLVESDMEESLKDALLLLSTNTKKKFGNCRHCFPLQSRRTYNVWMPSRKL